MDEYTIAGGIVILIDPEDRPQLEKRHWFGLTRHGYTQVRTTFMQDNRKHTLLLARQLMQATPDQHVIHLNGNRLDFRKSNLRVISKSTSSTRRQPRKRYRGVTFNKRKGLYQARFQHNKISHFLGYHATEEAAAEAVDRKAIEILGELARLNLESSRKFLPKEET